MKKNFYNILGVDTNAKPNHIKNAFRKLSLQFHPDKMGGDVEKFKEINEAYQILSDPEKKTDYDSIKTGGMINPEDIFKMFFDGSNFEGVSFGMPFGFGGSIQKKMQKPTPIIKTIEITLQQGYTGTNYPIEIERWIQDGKMKRTECEKIYVDIPKGIDDNEMIIIRNKGNILNDSNYGDVKIFIKIRNETRFERSGMDLIVKKKLSLKESLTGFTFDLKHITGKVYTINGTTVIKPGYRKTIKGMGMKREEQCGDMIIQFEIIFPNKLTEDQIFELKKIL
tara:strand:- start:1442 stop:2284 length:843 start_codon:yes stop_codon:yes gene_type:complete